MEFIDDDLLRYSERHTSPEPAILKKINRDTHANVLKPRMLSGHLQGRLLAMISKMIAPAAVLEIGTYTGYSAIALAEGLAAGGKLITIDKNEELEEKVRGYIREAGLGSVIDYRIGKAADLLPGLHGPFDLVFIDADKENNGSYFDLIIDKVSPGGYILIDNVLWSGKVLDAKPDKDTRAILDFNARVQDDARLENILLPFRDGIMLARKVIQ